MLSDLKIPLIPEQSKLRTYRVTRILNPGGPQPLNTFAFEGTSEQLLPDNLALVEAVGSLLSYWGIDEDAITAHPVLLHIDAFGVPEQPIVEILFHRDAHPKNFHINGMPGNMKIAPSRKEEVPTKT